MIIPFAPRAPYKEVEAASFNTTIDSISAEFREAISPSYGSPSTTYSGLVPALIEPTPRTRTVAEVPGCPLLFITCTPATAPDKELVTLETCLFSKRSEEHTSELQSRGHL